METRGGRDRNGISASEIVSLSGELGGMGEDLRWDPFLTRIAGAEIVREVRDDLPLGHYVFIAFDEHLSNMSRH